MDSRLSNEIPIDNGVKQRGVLVLMPYLIFSAMLTHAFQYSERGILL